MSGVKDNVLMSGSRFLPMYCVVARRKSTSEDTGKPKTLKTIGCEKSGVVLFLFTWFRDSTASRPLSSSSCLCLSTSTGVTPYASL